MLIFNKNYFALFVLVFLTELLIALYVNDSFVRPYLGDVLVVILIYCFVKSFFKIAVWPAVLGVFAFALFVEFCQYLNIVETLNLQHSNIARTVIGTSFSWIDVFTYVVGAAFIIIGEKAVSRKR